MNKVILVGRLTKDPEPKSNTVVKYTLAVDRKFKRDGQPTADFIECVTFGRQSEFALQYLHKGMKVGVCGSMQTGSYTAQDGSKRKSTEVVVEEHYFMESKAQESAQRVTEPSDVYGTRSDNVIGGFQEAVQSELPFD